MPLDLVKQHLDNFKRKYDSSIAEHEASSEKILEACRKVSESWSGSFAGFHGRLYYQHFERPPLSKRFSVEWGVLHGLPQGWEEKSVDQVKQRIEELAGGISLDAFEKESNRIRLVGEELREEIAISFSKFSFSNPVAKEKQLLEEIESYKIGLEKNSLIASRMPRRIVSRDSEAVMEGMYTPTHIYYEGAALESQSICESINKLLKLGNRLVRQLENEIVAKSSSPVKSNASTNKVQNLIEKPNLPIKENNPISESHFKNITIKELYSSLSRLTLGAWGVILGIVIFVFGSGYHAKNIKDRLFAPKEQEKTKDTDAAVAYVQSLLGTILKLNEGVARLEVQHKDVADQIEKMKKELPAGTSPQIQTQIEHIANLNIATNDTVTMISGLAQGLSSVEELNKAIETNAQEWRRTFFETLPQKEQQMEKNAKVGKDLAQNIRTKWFPVYELVFKEFDARISELEKINKAKILEKRELDLVYVDNFHGINETLRRVEFPNGNGLFVRFIPFKIERGVVLETAQLVFGEYIKEQYSEYDFYINLTPENLRIYGGNKKYSFITDKTFSGDAALNSEFWQIFRDALSRQIEYVYLHSTPNQ